MSWQTALDGAFAAAGAAGWGCVSFQRAERLLTPIARERVLALCPRPASILVAAFPYYAGERGGNLSLYARGEDYHLVLGRRLDEVCRFLLGQAPEHLFRPGVDSSPLPERELAWMAGLGLRGKNGLLLLPPYGSYVFLGTILTDLPLALPAAEPSAPCISCGRCLSACPTGALGPEGVDIRRCLSDLTQRKGELSPEEESLLKAHPLVWGCDLCQTVCPYNRGVAHTTLPEFTEDLICALSPEDLDGLTNRTFRDRYGGRAFSWRGPGPLRRNLTLKKE